MDIFGPPGKIRCPFHNDHKPSAMLYEDGGLHCFTCGEHAANRVDLVRKIYFNDEPYGVGIALAKGLCRAEGFGVITGSQEAPQQKAGASPEAIAAMTEFTGLANKNLQQKADLLLEIKKTRGLKDPIGLHLGVSSRMLITPVRNALRNRGMHDEEIDSALFEAGLTWEDQRYRLGYRLVIPEMRHKETVYYQARSLFEDETKYLNPSLPRPIFGLESLEAGNSFIFIGEGPFDVLPFIEAGESALAILGSHGNDNFVDHLEHRQVVIGFDRDLAGLQRGAALTAGLKSAGIDATHIPPPQPYKDYCEWISDTSVQSVINALYFELP